MIKIERPEIVKVVSWAAGNGDRSENGDYIYGKKKLRQIDSRIKYLIINIEDAEIVRRDSVVPERKIFFGAFVVSIVETLSLGSIAGFVMLISNPDILVDKLPEGDLKQYLSSLEIQLFIFYVFLFTLII